MTAIKFKIKKGDRVLLERAGDVIPKIVKVVEVSSKKMPVFKVPTHCPVCQTPIVKEKEEDVAFRCPNVSCSGRLERNLTHFASRGAMDIEGLGEAVVEDLSAIDLIEWWVGRRELNEARFYEVQDRRNTP